MPRRPDSPFARLTPKARPLIKPGRPVSLPRPEYDRPGMDIYNSPQWAQLSAKVRKEVGCCERCGRRDGQLYVDHIIELRDGGAPFDRCNLMVLCATCHTNKTRATAKARAWQPLAERINEQLRRSGWVDDEC